LAKTPNSRRPKPGRDKAPPQNANKDSGKGGRKPQQQRADGRPDKRSGNRQSGRPSGKASGNALWIYGRHAALAALANPRRTVAAVRVTEAFADTRDDDLAAIRRTREDAEDWSIELTHGRTLERMLGEGAVHQGIAVQTKPLDQPDVAEIRSINDQSVVLALDQATDPRNVGAAIRAAAAFGAHAVITTARSAPPESGALAKAAAGALEQLAYVRAPNLARALDSLKENGFWTIGLAGEAETPIGAAPFDRPTAIVIGAEGSGLRRLTLERCDAAVHIPIAPAVESLNLATAAAIALYEKSRANGGAS
jgi:23S rRNA (guanosine2251-2'-O)-methyltransferase